MRSLSRPEVRGLVLESKPIWGRVEVTYEYRIGDQRLTGKYAIHLGAAVAGPLPRESARRLKEGNKSKLAEFPPG